MEPQEVRAWVLFAISLAVAGVSFWNWLIRPLKKEIETECENRKRADENRDAVARGIADSVQRMLGRVEMLERQWDVGEKDRTVLHSDVRALNVQVDNIEKDTRTHEMGVLRQMSELREQMKDMELRIHNTVRSAITEAIRDARKPGDK